VPSRRVGTALERLEGVIESLLAKEGEWRELATHIQERRERARRLAAEGRGLDARYPLLSAVIEFATRAGSAASELEGELAALSDSWYHIRQLDKTLGRELHETIDFLGELRDELRRMTSQLIVTMNTVELGEVYERGRGALEGMRKLCAKAERWHGRRVCYFDYDRPEELSFSAAANDISTMIHRAAERLARIKGRAEAALGARVSEVVYAARDAPRELVEACLAFERAVEEVQRMGLVATADRGYQLCIARRDAALMRLGSAAGHGARLTADGRLTYFDDDSEVNRALKGILEENAGCRCRAHERGVECEGCDARRAAAVLPIAISMDLRRDFEGDAARARELLRRVLGAD